MRPHNARKIRIETLAMNGADHLLQNHRHLFFFQAIWRRPNISLGVLAKSGSIDALDASYSSSIRTWGSALWFPNMNVS